MLSDGINFFSNLCHLKKIKEQSKELSNLKIPNSEKHNKHNNWSVPPKDGVNVAVELQDLGRVRLLKR